LKKKLLVIGGGAAGFFCAVNAARLNRQLVVIIVEKSNKLLSKVKVSGGGRCNVTHACYSISEMAKRYPRGHNFVKKTFHQFFTTHTINWFKERGVDIKEESDGRMFPVTNSSQTIIDCLLQEAGKYGVEIIMQTEVQQVIKTSQGFTLSMNNNRQLQADYVCIASGGYPKASMFAWLLKTGHSIAPPVPSLFTFNMPGNNITQLMGVAVTGATIKIINTRYQQSGPVLITHWGLSGPAVLKLSAYAAIELAACNWRFLVMINWLPAYNENSLKQYFQQYRFNKAAQKIINKNPFQLPQRLWHYLLQQSDINDELRWADLPAKEQNKLIKNICAMEFAVNGKTTFKEEFVTAGGIKLNEIDSSTMMSNIQPQLYFAGEIMDVDGVTGGFNFQHAWTSGYIAAKAIADASAGNIISPSL
jgi:predicted Rossmann fold flavoprotein